VDDATLNPRHLWADKNAYDASLRKLGGMFIENFKIFMDTPDGRSSYRPLAVARNLVNAGPQL
jgi:ATP-dependent phosphoenolpyruvate carboxykinase